MARGTAIAGFWVFWPWHGDEYARVFKTEDDAVTYIPVVKTKHGKPFPAGPKWVMHVKWDWDKHEWTHDLIVKYTQQQVEAQFIEQGEQSAA